MDSILGCILMAAITLPVSFAMARVCLKGVVRVVTRSEVITGTDKRSMLSSQP